MVNKTSNTPTTSTQYPLDGSTVKTNEEQQKINEAAKKLRQILADQSNDVFETPEHKKLKTRVKQNIFQRLLELFGVRKKAEVETKKLE